MHLRRRHTRTGFAMADVIMGMLIVGVLWTALTMSVHQQNRISRQLADQRASMRLAMEVMEDLQAGRQPAEPSAEEVTVKMAIVDETGPGGRVWVEVRVTHAERSAALIGLVPADARRHVRLDRRVAEVGP